ncbi:alpha/beta-hydrolase [Cylindrobasidium torrendii FP15055 ss-10]|uniref:Alpha/beta-hydrolase n=1 Tax=Cylindrobasidium torrendii FP15055 ss-10 TaxID=1314674 RepID=A0A0D7AU75_9AGAR|nr:alpha/beta-hydrolase [Cylindrobasidium torrendii FP15055 ss-10]
MFSPTLFALLGAALVLAQDAPTFDWDTVSASDTLDWVDCYDSFKCARFNVPLNYSDVSVGSATLAVVMLPAAVGSDDPSYRGPVFFNPGGSGVSGVEALVTQGDAAVLSARFGPTFDVVSFDPRGVGRSTPRIQFFKTAAEKALWDLTNPTHLILNATTVKDGLSQLWAQSQLLGTVAKEHDTGILNYVTTDNVAHDIIKMNEQFGRDKVQYYGISYGTALGAVLAALYPDKIERLVIDGVLETGAYFSGRWEHQLDTIDAALELFYNGCHEAGAELCGFYADSPAQIKANLLALLEAVRQRAVPVYNGPDAAYGIVDFAALKFAIEQAAYSPYTLYQTLSFGLAALAQGDGSIIFQFTGQEVYSEADISESLNAPYGTERTWESEFAISCADMEEITDGPEELLAYYESVKNISYFMDAVMWQRTRCSGWKVHPEHFMGPVMGNTSFPLLLLGNTADPVTPVSAAKTMSGRFPGSVVLTQNSGGHTTLSASSNCTVAAVAAYFINGTLPSANTVCETDSLLFPPLSEASA